MKHRYIGHATVTAEPTGGAEALRRWAVQAGEDGRIWLADTVSTDAVLLLDDRVISEPHNWQGTQFSVGIEALEITVEAEDADDAGVQLTIDLFSHFPGQAERGEACFPLAISGTIVPRGRKGRVLVAQIDKSLMKAGVGAVECLTLRIDPADSDREENWRAE